MKKNFINCPGQLEVEKIHFEPFSARTVFKKICESPLTIIFAITFAFVLSGCQKLPIPKIIGKKRAKVAWTDRIFPIRKEGKTEIKVNSRGEKSAGVRLFSELIDGIEYGTLTFHEGNSLIHKVQKCWRGNLVDATEIRWANGDSWVLFAWDFEKDLALLRTLTLFHPRSLEMFSCEMEFQRGDDKKLSGIVKYCFTWNPGYTRLEKYRKFLDAMKEFYADAKTWAKETRGIRISKFPPTVPVTFKFSPRRPLQDQMLRNSPE